MVRRLLFATLAIAGVARPGPPAHASPVPVAILTAVAAATETTAPDDSLRAEIPTYQVPPVRVVGQKAPLTEPLVAPRTLFDRAALERRDAIDLARALLPAAGLRIMLGPDGASAGASLRGLGPDRTAVLLDGRPLNAAQGGAVDLAALDPEGLERVEIVRGAVGALYGPEALAGAVNLVRRRDRRAALSLRAAGGSGDRGVVRGRLALVHGRGDGDLAFGAETRAPRLGPLTAGARSMDARLRVTHRPRWAGFAEATVERSRVTRDLPGSPAFPTPSARLQDDVFDAAAAVRGALLPGGLLDAELAWREQDRVYDEPDGALGPVHDRHENRALRGRLNWKRDDGVSASLEGIDEHLRSTTDGTPDRLRGAAALRVDRAARGWAWSTAARVDGTEGFAPAAGGRVSVTRTLHRSGESGSLRARAGAGTSFRPPTFDDLFWPARATAAGNPHLAPERAWDADLGVVGDGAAGRLELTVFASRVDRLIQWTPGADGVWRPSNVGRARIVGVEGGGETTLPTGRWPVHLLASATWLDARDATGDPVTGGKRLVARAPFRLYTEAELERGAWRGAVTLDATSRIPLTAANTKRQPGRALVGLRTAWQAAPTIRFDLDWTNLFDTPYEDVRGYPAPGREILVGLRWTPEAPR